MNGWECRSRKEFLEKLTNQNQLIEEVLPLVEFHMAPPIYYSQQTKKTCDTETLLAVERIDRLVRVSEVDQRGRPPIEFENFEAGEWLLKQAEELNLKSKRPEPILKEGT